MLYDVELFRQLNCKGVVLGLLTKDGNIDVQRTTQLVEVARPMEVTFHRAFDRVVNPLQALEDIISTGCTRLLTSGQELSAIDGKNLIKILIEQANSRIVVMPGSGIRSHTISAILSHTGATEIHSSARIAIPSAMQFSTDVFREDSECIGVDSIEIKNMKTVLRDLRY
jgi:copper homeostasis protein